MVYDPRKHNRRSMRLKGYDYTKEGLYFVSICCQNKVHRFGEIEDGVMHLNACGQIAHDEWINLTERFPNMELDEFVIMPDHMHGIVSLAAGATLAVAPIGRSRATVKVVPTMSPRWGDIVGTYKSLVTKDCLDIYKSENRKNGKIVATQFPRPNHPRRTRIPQHIQLYQGKSCEMGQAGALRANAVRP